VTPEVLALLVILAGLMTACLRTTQLNVWEAHRRCPRCNAIVGHEHAEDCDLKDRL
jgi:hypothetical protein